MKAAVVVVVAAVVVGAAAAVVVASGACGGGTSFLVGIAHAHAIALACVLGFALVALHPCC